MSPSNGYALVEYIEDGILQVCHSSKIYKRKKGKKVFAEYLNKKRYACNIICWYKEKKTLESFMKNIMQKLPVVILNKIDTTCESKYKAYRDFAFM